MREEKRKAESGIRQGVGEVLFVLAGSDRLQKALPAPLFSEPRTGCFHGDLGGHATPIRRPWVGTFEDFTWTEDNERLNRYNGKQCKK